jgi:hypothetical protein
MGAMTTTTGLFHNLLNFHVTVNQIGSDSVVPSVVGGLIGGATVFAGVLFAEYLTRKRERIWRFDDERHNLLVRGADIFIPGLAYSQAERDKRSLEFVAQLMLLRSHARPPLPKATEIVEEIEAIYKRYKPVADGWRKGGPIPDANTIIGTKLAELSYRKRSRWRL